MHTSTIAIVSDDLSCRHIMRSVLADAGYAVLEYDTSMLEVPPDGAAALCLNVDSESSFQVLHRLISTDADLPIIVTGPSEVTRRALDSGAYDFVPMPLDGALFARCVSHAVEKRHLTEQVRRLSSRLSTQSNDQVVPLRELEREAIGRALRATNGSVTKAAKLLGIGRATLYRRLASPEMASLRPRRGYSATPAHATPALGSTNGSALLAISDPR